MLIFISDLHLRTGARLNLSRAAQFERFWQRIEQSRRGGVAELVIVGDFFDLVRTPDWLQGELRPYSDPSDAMAEEIDHVIEKTLELEKPFVDAIRSQVESGGLKLHLLMGNHDRLLEFSPRARARIRQAFGMPGGDEPFPDELRFPEYGVLAHHGHRNDDICHDPGAGPSFSDIFCPELIVRFPIELRARASFDHPHLDDIDDVRPVFAVPAWVNSLARGEAKEVGAQVSKVWKSLVEEFLDNRAVKHWFKDNHKRFRFDFPAKVKLLLSLSARRGIQYEPKLIATHDLLFRVLDVKFAHAAYKTLQQKENRGLRYVVNGHTHFGCMTPLGQLNGQKAVYFNLGTWRTVHQLGNVAKTSPTFLAFDAMGYLAFFPKDDALGREYEWWQGAATHRDDAAAP